MKQWEGDDIKFVIVSVDTDIGALEDMLGLTGATFTPYIVPAAPQPKLLAAVAGLGGTYPEVIPYGIVLDRDGKVFREWAGWQSIEAWEGAMEELLQR
ncbi:MAG: hypothetical protein GY898_28510 [Proteobacteria bacterium]|nr:hypothetical protein [Pseudomonadota bacterium]